MFSDCSILILSTNGHVYKLEVDKETQTEICKLFSESVSAMTKGKSTHDFEANYKLEDDELFRIGNYHMPDEILEAVEIALKYEGYIRKAEAEAKKMASLDSKLIPNNINYDEVDNIALEAREKLKKVNPQTIGQASRISGVNPADISVLVLYIEKLRRESNGF